MIRLSALALFLTFVPSASAQQIQVDLSRYPSGQEVPANQVISNEWQALGILFAARAAAEVPGVQGSVWPLVGGSGVGCSRYFFFTPDVFGAVGIFRFVEPGTSTPAYASHFEMVAGWQAGEAITVVGFDEAGAVTAQQSFVAPPCGGFCSGPIQLSGRFHYVEVRTQGNPGIGFDNCGIGGGFGLRFTPCPSASETYCTAGTSASGCRALLSAGGTPSASAPSGFLLSATGVEGDKSGIFFFGTSGRQANPWGNGTSFQCVAPPVARAGLLTGSGSSGLCDGSLAQDLNALWCPSCPKSQKNPGVGATVQAQLWYRDPFNTSNQTTSLSDAVEFVVCD